MKTHIFAILARAKRFVRTHKKLVAMSSFGMFLMLLVGVFLLRSALPISAEYTSSDHRISQPFSMTLSQNVRSIDVSKITLSPHVEGKWRFEAASLFSGDRLTFVPKTTFKINTTYAVTVPSVQRILVGAKSGVDASFRTEAAPSIDQSALKQNISAATIAADHTFKVRLASKNHGLRDLELRTTPAIELTRILQDDQEYQWKPKVLLPQGETISLEVFDRKNNVSLYKKDVKISPQPRLTSPKDRDHVGEKDTIALIFDQPMVSKQKDGKDKLISFDINGQGAWKSPTEYVFTPEKLEPGKKHTYKIMAGLRSKAGGIVAEEQTGTFATTGAVYVTSSSPQGRNLKQAAQVVSMTFDQAVDKVSAQERLRISSGTVGAMSWEGNTLKVMVTNLGFQQTVTVSVLPGVKNAGFGLPSTETFTHSFTTEIRTIRLNVPMYSQQRLATCSAAALRMALAYRGIGSDEMGLVNAMGYSPRSIDRSTDPAIWDDPQVMFVGSVDGRIGDGTGAGPDAPPVAKAARAYGRSAEAVRGISAGWIATQLHADNPVLMFGAERATANMTWRTPSGAMATVNLTGHVTTVIGVVGEPSNPLGFYVNDPLRSSTQYWSTAEVNANIARDPYRQAVVVY